jgi:hypothetical protein
VVPVLEAVLVVLVVVVVVIIIIIITLEVMEIEVVLAVAIDIVVVPLLPVPVQRKRTPEHRAILVFRSTAATARTQQTRARPSGFKLWFQKTNCKGCSADTMPDAQKQTYRWIREITHDALKHKTQGLICGHHAQHSKTNFRGGSQNITTDAPKNSKG